MTYDKDGYPDAVTLQEIQQWPMGDFPALMSFCQEAWNSEYGWFEQSPGFFANDDSLVPGTPWKCATGGWSGNESIIKALQGNTPFWWCAWRCSASGGYYEFSVGLAS